MVGLLRERGHAAFAFAVLENQPLSELADAGAEGPAGQAPGENAPEISGAICLLSADLAPALLIRGGAQVLCGWIAAQILENPHRQAR